jgi:phage baseplate assembly protein W
MATLTKLYSDIDLTFTRQPGKGDIALSYDDNAVIRSVRNLLLTDFYERPFQPEVGSNINSLLFEPVSSITANAIEEEIQNVITNFEPRATVSAIDVTALPDQNAFFVRVTFFIGNNTAPTAVNLLLERNR